MSNFYKLLGFPLDLIIDLVGDSGFSKLYGTGDRVVRARIAKCPLICDWKPNIYSENVIELTCDISPLRAFDGKSLSSLEYRYWRGRTTKFYRIPSTMKKLIINCPQEAWNLVTENMTSVRCIRLGNIIEDNFSRFSELDELHMEDRGHKPVPHSVIESLPRTLDNFGATELPKDCDLSHLNIRTLDLTLARCLYGPAIFPNTITNLDAPEWNLTQSLPNLEIAHVATIRGEFPKLRHLTVSVIEKDYKIESIGLACKRFMPACGIFYSSGHLVCNGKNVEQFKLLPVKSIEYNAFGSDPGKRKEEVRMKEIRSAFPDIPLTIKKGL